MGDFFATIGDKIQAIPLDAGMQAALDAALPLASWVLRLIMIALGVIVVLRCLFSLFREKNHQEVWGTLSLPNGTQYEINHWENVIGRAGSADVILDFPFISRNHAAILRDDKGNWTLFPLQSKNGTQHNGEEVSESVSLHPGDVINLGGMELYFYPLSEEEERDQNRRLGVQHRKLSPNTTLAYLTFFQILMLMQSLITVKPEQAFGVVVSFATLVGVMWGLYAVYRTFKRTAFEVETLALFLCSLSFGVTAAYSPKALTTQTFALIIGIGIFFMLSLALRDLKMAVSLRWPVAAMAGLLLSFNLLLGQRIFGAKNWMAIGPFSFQPSEFIKIAFIIATATTLDRLFNNRNLIFTTLFAGFCGGCLALMSDFGTALVFFVAFLVVAFLRSGNLGFLVMMASGAGLGAGIILHFKPYIANRFEAWRHVWEFASTTGYQQTRTMSALASGGLFGKAPDDVFLKKVGAANTDLVFGVVGEEFGLILALFAVVCIVAFAVLAYKCTAAARSSFYTIASCTAAAMLAFQTSLNVFGSVDILPLTGVTFPFLSVGGSSMMSCWGLLAFIKAADTRLNASFTVKRPKLRTWSWRKDRVQEDASWEEDELEEEEGFYPDEQEELDAAWSPEENEEFWDDYHWEDDR